MRINSTNNQSFRGISSLFKIFRNNKASNTAVIKAQETIQTLTNRAEERLQQRLVSFESLMEDFYSGDILEMSSGKKFTGKYLVPGDKLEHIFHIKDGVDVGSMVRLKTGQKQFANRGEYSKEFKLDLPIKEAADESEKMLTADILAGERMRHNFVIRKVMESPEGFVYLTK